jgi:hypothetical protein
MPVPPPVTTQTYPETSNSLEASKWCVAAMLSVFWLYGKIEVDCSLQVIFLVGNGIYHNGAMTRSSLINRQMWNARCAFHDVLTML